MAEYKSLFVEFIKGGISEEANKRYSCAVELYYKAFLKLIDMELEKEGIIVSSNEQRYREADKLNSDIKRQIIDKLYIIYRDTYSTTKTKKDCQQLKNGIKKTIFLRKIKQFKEISKAI
ncbi:hypothetical protein KY312_04550 [Candidatus Woesearchaeota archaeon]|nr:hypothetical protein [Candidatus Woesearchaeota archaeon]